MQIHIRLILTVIFDVEIRLILDLFNLSGFGLNGTALQYGLTVRGGGYV